MRPVDLADFLACKRGFLLRIKHVIRAQAKLIVRVQHLNLVFRGRSSPWLRLIGLGLSSAKLCLGHERCRGGLAGSLLLFDVLVDIGHRDGHWLVQIFNHLVFLFKLALDAPDGQFEELVLALRLNDLVLQEVLVLLEGLGARHPVLDLLVQLLLLRLHLVAELA